MPPKTPSELKEQLERENTAGETDEGRERTAEGLDVEPPTRGDFFGNLEKVSAPDGSTNRGAV
jgi:hypothetical protein